MEFSRARLRCRSRNPFTPSIALWQHFIHPSPLQSPRPRLASSNSPAVNSVERTGLATPEETPQRPSSPPVRYVRFVGQNPVLDVINQDGKLVDYKGSSIRFWMPPNHDGSSVPWKVSYHESKILSGWDRLSKEIHGFYTYAKPNRYEALARRDAIERIKTHVQKILPGYELEVFGSEKTGLALATSEIDLRLKPKVIEQEGSKKVPPSKPPRSNLLCRLRELRIKLKKMGPEYTDVQLWSARYPLVVCRDDRTGLQMQIVSCDDTSPQQHFIQQYMREYSYLVTLLPIIKTMLQERGLTNVHHGGIGSYPLFMMIVAALRHNPPKSHDAVGGLFSFLTFWKDFNTTKKGISLEPNELFDKGPEKTMPEEAQNGQESSPKRPDWLLSLRDPADPTNDLGRKGLYIKNFQATCGKVLELTMMKLSKRGSANLLHYIVGYVYTANKARRDQLENAGRKALQGTSEALAAKASEINKRLKSEKTQSAPLEQAEGKTEVQAEELASKAGLSSTSETHAIEPSTVDHDREANNPEGAEAMVTSTIESDASEIQAVASNADLDSTLTPDSTEESPIVDHDQDAASVPQDQDSHPAEETPATEETESASQTDLLPDLDEANLPPTDTASPPTSTTTTTTSVESSPSPSPASDSPPASPSEANPHPPKTD